MDFVTRLKQFINHVALPISQFADTAQIPRPTLSQILNGRNKKISNELIAKLHEAFPNLNVMWLLFGDGDMELSPNIKISERQNQGNSLFDADQVSDYEDPAPYNTSKYSSTEYSQSTPTHTPRREKQQDTPTPTTRPAISVSPDSSKRVQSIMVFYSDNSFEIFTPSAKPS